MFRNHLRLKATEQMDLELQLWRSIERECLKFASNARVKVKN